MDSILFFGKKDSERYSRLGDSGAKLNICDIKMISQVFQDFKSTDIPIFRQVHQTTTSWGSRKIKGVRNSNSRTRFYIFLSITSL
jgi:hypothetical protein